MITIDNYFNKIDTLEKSTWPEALKKGHEFVLKATKNGVSWTAYSHSDAIRHTIDMYLEKLNEFLNKSSNAGKKPTKKEVERKEHDSIIKKNMHRQSVSPAPKSVKKEKAKHSKPSAAHTHHTQMVERMPEELRFIRRFVNLNGKTKTKEELLRFINGLQKAIVEKRIRKTSAYAAQIRYIQTRLIEVYNEMKTKIKLELKAETLEKMKELVKGEKVMDSVSFIKAYINLNGKPGMKKKADALLKRITRAVDKMIIPHNDPYIDTLTKITRNLEAFLDTPSMKALSIEKNELSGLEGILGCACQQQLNGVGTMPAIMNSMDFANLQFETIGLKGKWLDLIGDPSSNFTAMVFGKPKMGKSYLCIDFAGYLARNHGKVLYVAKEEGLDMTLQKKLNEKDVAHPNLYVSSVLPADLSAYDFIFLDSVNKIGLAPEDLNQLKATNPTKSFIFVFQSTKDGKFRGANSFQHDVDVVIEVPEKGKAIQTGRFNQGGEIEIFDDDMTMAV